MTTAAETREELDKVTTLVLTARRLLASGTLVDLSAIEARVRQVVAAVLAMPREEGRSLCDEMTALIGRLDRLGDDLREQQRRLHARSGGNNRLQGYAHLQDGREL